ncbi:MAG: hypothetical protein ACFWT5_13625 [Pseudomonas helleri]|jgi:MFS family permease
MFIPRLPLIASDLGASEASVQRAVSVFLADLLVGMLFYGSLSDRYGRRPLCTLRD